MEPSGDLDALQKAADYRSLKKFLKPLSTWSITLGLLGTIIGLSTLPESIFFILPVIFGFLLIIPGMWVLISPNPKAILFAGIAFFMAGGWNIFISLLQCIFEGITTEPVLFIIFAGVEVRWGIQCLRRYKRFSGVSTAKPSDVYSNQIIELVKSIKWKRVENDDDIVEFQTNYPTFKSRWKGKLFDKSAVFVEAEGRDIFLAKKEDVVFTEKRKTPLGKSFVLMIQINERHFSSKILNTSLERYEKWKAIKS